MERARVRVREIKECQKCLVPDGTSKGWGQEDQKSSKVDVPGRNRAEQDKVRVRKVKECQKWLVPERIGTRQG